MTLQDLFYLQGYGCYVWPAYGLVAIFLILQLFVPWKRWRDLRRKRAQHAQTQ